MVSTEWGDVVLVWRAEVYACQHASGHLERVAERRGWLRGIRRAARIAEQPLDVRGDGLWRNDQAIRQPSRNLGTNASRG